MTVYSLQEVQEATLDYFNGDTLATDTWIKKYALKDIHGNIYEKTPDDMHRRLAKELARIEDNYPNPMSEQEIYELLKGFKYIVPGGSPMEGIGNLLKIQSLSNCYVVGNNEDSYGSIILIDEEQVHIMRRRGGVGSDLSHLRPRGAYTTCVAHTSTGIVPFAERYSNSTRETAQEGRRGARMISLDITHPDAEEFIDAKLEQGKITGANISVRVTDEFMNCVKSGKDFLQRFPIDIVPLEDYEEVLSELKYNELTKALDKYNGNFYLKKKNAKKLWNKIIKNAHNCAEPGILFIDTIRKESPSDFYGTNWKSESSNPCGEIPMNPYSSCILTAINLFSYVDNPFTKEAQFNVNLFKQHVNKAQRIIDDIVDLEIEKIDQILAKVHSDPESEDTKFREINLWNKIRQRIVEGRRTGLGITAEGDMLAALNMTYGTPVATSFSSDIHRIMAMESYKSSIELAKERGCFPIWNYENEKCNPFINRVIIGELLYEYGGELFDDYKKYGRRNIANLTIAPTGTISIMTQTTSGIEPCFLPYYKRRKKTNDSNKATFKDEVGDLWEEYLVFHHKFIDWFMLGDNHGSNFMNRVECEEWLKNKSEDFLNDIFKHSPYNKATSNDVDWVEKVRMQGEVQKWVDHAISVTVNVPENTTVEIVDKIYMTAYESGCKGVTIYRDGSRSGVLVSVNDKKEEKFGYIDAIKRPESLECDIYHKQVLKEDMLILVGLIDNKPYEIFAFKNGLGIPSKLEKGKIIKRKKRHYSLIVTDEKGREYVIENIIDYLNENEQNETRQISTMLRHKINPKFIVEQIEAFATVTSQQKAMERVLRNYVQDEDNKEKCPECGSELKREQGCKYCKNCGWGACS